MGAYLAISAMKNKKCVSMSMVQVKAKEAAVFITILRGQVAHENWPRLQQQYDKLVNSLPDGLVDTYLMQCHEQPTLWEIVTIWANEESFEKDRAQKKTEAAELIFCDLGAVPELQSFQVRRGHQRI